jgi:hypothetical protein
VREAVVRSIRAPVALAFARVPGKPSHVYAASLRSPVVSGRVEVYDAAALGVSEYFAQLGRLWLSGWEDERGYRSLEGHLRLVARRDATGHVVVEVDLSSDRLTADYRWGASLVLEPSRLGAIATEIADTLA